MTTVKCMNHDEATEMIRQDIIFANKETVGIYRCPTCSKQVQVRTP